MSVANVGQAISGVSGEQPAPSGVVVSVETAGLGNRLKSWVSAMRLSADARVFWPVTPNMPARFADLFTNDCAVDAVSDGARVYGSWRLAVVPEDEAHLPAGFATVGAGAHPLIRGAGKLWWSLRGRPDDRYRYMVFPKTHSRRSTRADARHLDLEYGRIPQALRDVYVPLFARIDVQPAIVQRVEAWAAEVGLDAATDAATKAATNAATSASAIEATNAATIEAKSAAIIGVQVRTWRDDPRRYRKYHRPAVRRLRRLMDSAGDCDRFLVVSDDDAIIAELSARYGAERILHFPRTTARAESWRSAEGVTEDLIDMLLLAKTRRLYASYLSTFSEAAWWLGGASAEVEVF